MVGYDRRAWNRYPCDLKVLCRAVNGSANAPGAGRIRDVSCGGLKLESEQRFAPGVPLNLNVVGANDLAPRSLAAEVVHAEARPDGHWTLGCRLAGQINERDLARLLSLFQPPSPAERPSPLDAMSAPHATSPI